MELYSAVLAGWVQPADIFVQFFNHLPNAFWLDRQNHPTERFSILGSGKPANSTLRIAPFQDGEKLPFSWRPGQVGFLAYEGAWSLLDVDRAIVFDHDQQHLYFVGVFSEGREFEAWHHAALLRLGLSGGQLVQYTHNSPTLDEDVTAVVRHNSGDYLKLIQIAQKRIADGDIYQVCLTNEIRIRTKQDPLLVFLRLRKTNPAPYACLIRIGGKTLVSCSPEQFLQVSDTGKITSKPIKGTRPRSSDPGADQQFAEELRNDTKEQAENLMIVDLMRNDIGKVAQVGTVEVPVLFGIESYATVHQLVSTVTGQISDEKTALDAVIAAFPGGSMTGAPKIRAMEIIEELEAGTRGIYSGCVGYLGSNGTADFAMTIRSMVFGDHDVTIGVGGGITIDSNPLAELSETKLKAQVLLEALNAPDPWATW